MPSAPFPFAHPAAPPALFARLRRAALAVTLSCAALAGPAAAQQDGAGEWRWSVSPYMWGTSLAGRMATVPGVPPVDVDVGFDRILSNLDMAGMIVVNANNGVFGFSGDVQYVKLSAGSGSLAPLWGQAQIRVEQTILTLLGEYRIGSGPEHELWLLGGLRYWDVRTSMTLTPGTRPGRTASGSDSWVDPVIGLRGRRALGTRSYLTGWAYFGGFGVGADEAADIFGGIGYRFSDTTSGVLGYRWLSTDRTSGSFVYDVVLQGPVAGLTFRF